MEEKRSIVPRNHRERLSNIDIFHPLPIHPAFLNKKSTYQQTEMNLCQRVEIVFYRCCLAILRRNESQWEWQQLIFGREPEPVILTLQEDEDREDAKTTGKELTVEETPSSPNSAEVTSLNIGHPCYPRRSVRSKGSRERMKEESFSI